MTGRELVTRYFAALDAGDSRAVDDLFHDDCRIHRPERSEPLVGIDVVRAIVAIAGRTYEHLSTTLLDVVEEGDTVMVRLRHEAVHRGEWRTRIGTFDVPGCSLQWEAMAMFRLRDGRIAEERVVRDELGMLLAVGALTPA